MYKNKLEQFLNILKRQYSGEVFYMKDDNGFYVVLMTNRDLIQDKYFEEYFYKLAFDLFGEDSYKIYTCLDYLNEIPEIELNFNYNVVIKNYEIKDNIKIDSNIVDKEKINPFMFKDVKLGSYKERIISKVNLKNKRNTKNYNEFKLLEVA